MANMTETAKQAQTITDTDLCLRAGMMTGEVSPCLRFPGEALP